jgi:T5orf172 domain
MSATQVPLKPGVVYILRSDSLKDTVVKIGRSTRTAELRAWELSSATGVPTRFEVLYEEQVADCEAAERLIHRKLDAYRIRRDREFFQVPLKVAVKAVFETCLSVNQQLLLENSRLALYIKGGSLPSLTQLAPCSTEGRTRLRLIIRREQSLAELDLGDEYLIHCTPELIAQLQRHPMIEEVAFFAATEA